MNTVSRRDLLLSSTAAALGLSLSPSQLWADTKNAKATPLRALLEELCDAVIPATRTPGARDAGVAAFVEIAAAHGLNGASTALLSEFAAALDELADGSYLKQSKKRRRALLADIDARAFAEDSTLPQSLREWIRIKGLVVIGYYTSEVGASQELRYALTPGRFDPDVPLKAGERAWSSDWTGVKYA